jgi:hypothetical protein
LRISSGVSGTARGGLSGYRSRGAELEFHKVSIHGRPTNSSDLEVLEHGESEFHCIKAPFSALDGDSDQTAVFLDQQGFYTMKNAFSRVDFGGVAATPCGPGFRHFL